MQNYAFFLHAKMPKPLFKQCMHNIDQLNNLIVNVFTKYQTFPVE